MNYSIFNLVTFAPPEIEWSQSLIVQNILYRFMALPRFKFQFAIDERIVKVGLGCVVLVRPIVNLVDMSPIDGSKTHGTRFA